MSLWDKYEKIPREYLTDYRDIILYGVFHHIKALLLYPPNCACKGVCDCDEMRKEIVLTLDVEFYIQAKKANASQRYLSKMKFLLEIPDDGYLVDTRGKAYGLRHIQKDFKEREDENHFKSIDHLVWTLLRLGETYEPYIRIRKASITEAIEMILGTMPLKTNVQGLKKGYSLGGEKALRTHFRKYKDVCHFVAAFEFMKENNEPVSFNKPAQIEEFLKLSDWFRLQLLYLSTPHVKYASLFLEEVLLPLPSWVSSEEIDIPIEPFGDRVKELEEAVRNSIPMLKNRVMAH